MAEEIKPQFARDEDVERARAWWQENGRSITVGIAIGLAGVIGFNSWQSYQETQAENASVLFEQLRRAAETEASVEVIAADLMENYAATPYATHAALALAKTAVEQDNLEAAAGHLRWVLDNSGDVGLSHVARLRLATVLLASGAVEEAETLLTVDSTGGFTSRYEELRGDVYAANGDQEAARKAYQASLDGQAAGSAGGALIRLKLDSLGQ